MRKSSTKILKSILGVLLLTNICCFYPGDMIPLPLFVYEDGVIDSALSMNFDLLGIGAQSILIAQIMILWALLIKNIKMIIFLGRTSTLMLMIGIPLIMNYRNVNGWPFEFTTWLPFYLTGIVFLYVSTKIDQEELNTQNG